MEAHEIRNTLPLRSLRRSLLTLGSMALLGMVWLAFFLWALAITESGLVRWGSIADAGLNAAWQRTVVAFLGTEYGVYLPGAVLLLISLAIYFYRVPRARGPLTVPLEFAASTTLFLVVNLLLLYALYVLSERPVIAEVLRDMEQTQFKAMPYLTEPGLFLTVLMLLALYWLQATGRLRAYWRRLHLLHGESTQFPSGGSAR